MNDTVRELKDWWQYHKPFDSKQERDHRVVNSILDGFRSIDEAKEILSELSADEIAGCTVPGFLVTKEALVWAITKWEKWDGGK